MAEAVANSKEIQDAYVDYDRQQAINNFKIACGLGFVLMPAGTLLDRFVFNNYPQVVSYFFALRCISSVLIAIFFGMLITPTGRKYYRLQGVALFMIPASFIAYMIYYKDGAGSPYYAGLNLVLLMLAFVLHWTFRESFAASFLVFGLYLA